MQYPESVTNEQQSATETTESISGLFEQADDTDNGDAEMKESASPSHVEDTSSDTDDLSVEITIDGVDLDATQQHVVDTYEENIETFIRKNQDYGSSFTNSAKVESVLKYDEVREDELPALVARQIFVRGMLDKISRFYQLAFEQEGALVGDESIDDTLLDLGNYSIMLASELRAAEEE